MAKIIKLNLNDGQKIINPIKTTRKSTTNPFDKNPFKCQDFEGNTLPVTAFADVFVGKESNKLKMISASVMGSVTKLRNCIPESIINFVNKVKTGLTNAWDYANKPIELSGLKEGIHNALNYDVSKGISDSLSNIGKGISERYKNSILNTDVTEIGKGISDKWSALISNINIGHKKPSVDTPVLELKEMWLNQIALDSAKDSTKELKNGMKARVA